MPTTPKPPPLPPTMPVVDHQPSEQTGVARAPHFDSILEAVCRGYRVCELLPQREHWRLAQVLRRHLRAVLRCLARSFAAARDVDRCAELERAVLHSGHLEYLWTLCATLEWLPEDEALAIRERWLAIRSQLAGDARGLARAMTLRLEQPSDDEAVALRMTHSLPDTYGGPRPPVHPDELSQSMVSERRTASLAMIVEASPHQSPTDNHPVEHTGAECVDGRPTIPIGGSRHVSTLRISTNVTTRPAKALEDPTDEIDTSATVADIAHARVSDTSGTVSAEDAWVADLDPWVEELAAVEQRPAPLLDNVPKLRQLQSRGNERG